MTASIALIRDMTNDGLHLSLDSEGRIKVAGTSEVITLWLPVLQYRRVGFIRLLVMQDFIEMVDERAAIMEYDAADCHPTRDVATAAAYADALKNNQNLSNGEETR